MNTCNINTKTLETLYAGHDFYYDKSDDHSVWSKGYKQWEAIGEEEKRLIHGGWPQWMRYWLLNLNILEILNEHTHKHIGTYSRNLFSCM